MKEYLFLFRGGYNAYKDFTQEDWQKEMDRWMEWMQALAQQGRLVSAQPLEYTGKVVTGTKKVVSDGPFAEGKEMVGGYMICKAETYDKAVEMSKGCPILELENGTVEVRETKVREM